MFQEHTEVSYMKDDEQATPVHSACSRICRCTAAANIGMLQIKEKYMHYYHKGMPFSRLSSLSIRLSLAEFAAMVVILHLTVKVVDMLCFGLVL